MFRYLRFCANNYGTLFAQLLDNLLFSCLLHFSINCFCAVLFLCFSLFTFSLPSFLLPSAPFLMM